MKNLFITLAFAGLTTISFAQEIVRGNSFEDKNQNGFKDAGEKSYEGLKVSNGRDIVVTDKHGNYSIERIEGYSIFAIKPGEYQFILDSEYHPQFYQKDKSKIYNIPLHKIEGDDKFSVVLMGDIQVSTVDQLSYLGQVAVDELKDTDYEFLIALGDLVANTISLLPDVKATLGQTGKTNYYVLGNHDRDVGKLKNPILEDDDSFEKVFGPSTYSFDRGDAHFIVLKDIISRDKKNPKDKSYDPGIQEMQYQFLINDLEHVDKDKLVVICAHIPFFNELRENSSTAQLISVLENHENVFVATAHTHTQFQNYLSKESGRKGKPIHQLVAGAICGSWWKGEMDITGVPSSIMGDGTPQGYWLMHVDGAEYELEYKSSRLPASQQMHIWVPYSKASDAEFGYEVNKNDVWVNVYAGNDETTVELKIDDGEWQTIERKEAYDPYVLKMHKRHELGIIPTKDSGLLKNRKQISSHLWYFQLPEGLSKGPHMIEVKAENSYGLNATSNRMFWIK